MFRSLSTYPAPNGLYFSFESLSRKILVTNCFCAVKTKPANHYLSILPLNSATTWLLGKLMLRFSLWSFFLQKMFSISLNILFGQPWNTAVMLWASAPKCYLNILDRLQNCVCKAVDPSLLDQLKPLARCRNVANLSLFYRYCSEKCFTELIELVPFLLFYSVWLWGFCR